MKDSITNVYFGGPDKENGFLRTVLAKKIAKVPPGGHISFITYYLRDQRLVQDLILAAERGVIVNILIESKPRTNHANNDVIKVIRKVKNKNLRLKLLSRVGLIKPRIHEKLYCFSHPVPSAFIGSYNPSGNMPEQYPEIIKQINDQNIAHNVLVEFQDPVLANALIAHANKLLSPFYFYFCRFAPQQNFGLKGNNYAVHFWPRLTPNPIFKELRQLPENAEVKAAISHIRGFGVIHLFRDLVRRGISVEILLEHTQRRVPLNVEKSLVNSGVKVRRISNEDVAMHNKFILLKYGSTRKVIFGSFNWNLRSRWFNNEIAVFNRNHEIYDLFKARWEKIFTDASNTPTQE